MRRALTLSTLLAWSALAAAPASPLPFAAKVSKLKNGLTVARVPFDSPGIVAYYTAVRVGSRNEVEAGHTGFAHFFEHMMFRGTKRYPDGARGALLSSLGYSENAFTSDDVTVYQVSGPSSALATLVDVEADRFMTLEYAEPAFQTEARAVLGEYNKSAAGPDLKIEETVLATAFTTHTYRHSTLGFYEDIQAMPSRYEYSKTFFKRWYTPDNCVVVVVGDFDDAALMALIEAHYGAWAGHAADATVPAEPLQTAPRVASIAWTSPALPRVGLYWHTPAASTRTSDAAVAEVLGEYLAGAISPLYKRLVLEERLAESLSADATPHRDAWLFGIDAKLTDESHRAAVTAAIEAAVAEVARGAVDARRLGAIKDHLRFSLLMGLETPPEIADALAWAAGIYGSVDALGQQAQRLQAVTAKDLTAFAKKHLTPAGQTRLDFTVTATEDAP